MAVLQPIKYSRGDLQLLDQRLLPLQQEYLQVKTCEDAHQRIREMAVRGAPAIAIAGVLALAVELHSAAPSAAFESAAAAAEGISSKLDYLVTRRAPLSHAALPALLLRPRRAACLRSARCRAASAQIRIAASAEVPCMHTLNMCSRTGMVARRGVTAPMDVCTLCPTC